MPGGTSTERCTTLTSDQELDLQTLVSGCGCGRIDDSRPPAPHLTLRKGNSLIFATRREYSRGCPCVAAGDSRETCPPVLSDVNEEASATTCFHGTTYGMLVSLGNPGLLIGMLPHDRVPDEVVFLEVSNPFPSPCQRLLAHIAREHWPTMCCQRAMGSLMS